MVSSRSWRLGTLNVEDIWDTDNTIIKAYRRPFLNLAKKFLYDLKPRNLGLLEEVREKQLLKRTLSGTIHINN